MSTRREPTIDEAARAAAWETFAEACKATPTATATDRLRQYAEACRLAGEADTAVRTGQ